MVAQQGKFPRATNGAPQGQLGVFLVGTWLAHEVGRLALPYTVVFHNAGSRKPRPRVNILPTPMSGAVSRSLEAKARRDGTQAQLIELMALCASEAIRRCPDVYKPILANEKNVERMERLGRGYTALLFHIK